MTTDSINGSSAFKAGLILTYIYAFACLISDKLASIAIFSSVPIMICLFYKKFIVLNIDQKTVIKSIFVFVALILITVPFSHAPLTSLRQCFSYAHRFIPFFMPLFFIRKKQHILVCMQLIALSLLYTEIYSLFQITEGLRPSGPKKDIIFFASTILLAIIITSPLYLEKHQLKYQHIYKVIPILSIIILFFNQSRGVLVALFCIVFFWLLFLSRKKMATKGCYLLLGLILSGLIIYLIPSLQARVMNITNLEESSNLGRMHMWQACWNMFLSSPFVGMGFGLFKVFYNGDFGYKPTAARDEFFHNPHSDIFLFLSEGGLIGITAFFLFFFTLIYIFFKRHKQHIWLSNVGICLVIAILIAGLTHINLPALHIARLFMFSIGLSLSTCEKIQIIN